MKKNRNALAEPIKKLRHGLAVYKVNLSPYWMVRVRVPATGRYVVRSTKETSRLKAYKVAEEIAAEIVGATPSIVVPKSRTFENYAERFLAEQQRLVDQGVRTKSLQKQDRYICYQKAWGLIAFFGRRDIGSITTRDIVEYQKWSGRHRSKPLSWSSINNRTSCFRKIMRLALLENEIPFIPNTPKVPKRSTPRPFFQFHPLVSKNKDEYRALLMAARSLAKSKTKVRGTIVTSELNDFIVFVTNSFVRPTEKEAYGLRLRDCVINQNPERLVLKIQGKTGFRSTDTMPSAVYVYRRLLKRSKQNSPDDYLFLPQYANRSTAKRVMQRWFNAALEEAKKAVPFSGSMKHTPYSLRHTAICMRLVLSQGKVNIFNLARAAGTSVDMIENFYAKYLPPNPEMASNLQSFGQ